MTSTWDELKFYGQLARNLFTRPYDLHKIPGPPGYWGLGHIPKIMRPDYHVQMLEWANEYGGIYKFSLGCQWVVVISDPVLAAQVLGRGSASVPRKCIGYQFFDLATNHLGLRSFFTTTNEQQWAAVRKAAAPAFNMANVRRSFPHVLKHAKHIAEELAKPEATTLAHTKSQHLLHSSHMNEEAEAAGGGVDIQEHLELALLNVFVEALFDIEAKDFPGHDVAAAMNLVLEEANERLKVPLRGLVTWITKPKAWAAVRRAQCMLGETYGYLADVLRSRGPPDESDNNLWACLARVRDPATGELLSREQLIPEIGAFMMAGFDTSSHTIAWCLFSLATSPSAQQKVHEELATRGLLHGEGGEGRELVMEDLSQLPYLNCVIDETMRMYPVAATASVREVGSPVKVGDYTIPQGVIVWPMLYALHNAIHNWTDPEEFRPERWAEKHSYQQQVHSSRGSSPGPTAGTPEAATQQPSNKTARAFLPFSDGIKNCLGQNLGLMEVRTVLVSLLSRFRFELHPDMGGPQQVKSSMIMSLTLKMKGGLKLLCHPLSSVVPSSAASDEGSSTSLVPAYKPVSVYQASSPAKDPLADLRSGLPVPVKGAATKASVVALADGEEEHLNIDTDGLVEQPVVQTRQPGKLTSTLDSGKSWFTSVRRRKAPTAPPAGPE